MSVPAAHAWKDNGHLIADVAKLGYLEGTILDPTWGYGTFWSVWRPQDATLLYGSDLNPSKSPCGNAVDFTDLPFDDRSFDVVVFDPPYKLNGTPTDEVDERFGVHVPTRWQDRMELIRTGLDEATRVARRFVLLKCQDQVCSGEVRWQTLDFTEHAQACGFRLVDRFDLLGTARQQPGGRSQRHAHGRPSTLLVFQTEGAPARERR